MKLIKQSSKTDTDRCHAVTNSGKRCKRKSVEGKDLCKQHAQLQEQLEKHLYSYSGNILDEIPSPPSTLENEYADRWTQLCEMLHEFGQLRGGYLKDIYHMIMLEMLLDDIMEGIRNGNHKDYLNEYVTESGHLNNNINGLWVLKRDTEKELTETKKRFWMDPDGLTKLVKGKSLLSKESSASPSLRKVKSWRD